MLQPLLEKEHQILAFQNAWQPCVCGSVPLGSLESIVFAVIRVWASLQLQNPVPAGAVQVAFYQLSNSSHSEPHSKVKIFNMQEVRME